MTETEDEATPMETDPPGDSLESEIADIFKVQKGTGTSKNPDKLVALGSHQIVTGDVIKSDNVDASETMCDVKSPGPTDSSKIDGEGINQGIANSLKVVNDLRNPDSADGSSNSSIDSGSAKTPSISQCTPLSTPTNSDFNTSVSFVGTPSSAINSKKRKRLTPEERVLRDKERQEKRQKLEEEKQKKEQDKVERAKFKEQERIKREEEKRKKDEEKKQKDDERKQKEEERLKKIEEDRVKKEEEKQKREEERRKKEDERLKKEEERRKKEEEKKKSLEEKEREKQKLEDKKAKQAQQFTKFFQVSPLSKTKVLGTVTNADTESDKENKTIEEVNLDDEDSKDPPAPSESSEIKSSSRRIVLVEKKEECVFQPMPFQLKTDMALAPLIRRSALTCEEKDTFYINQNHVHDKSDPTAATDSEVLTAYQSNYIEMLKKEGGRKSERTDVKYESEIQVVVGNRIENAKEAGLIKWRMKLLQFSENRRPAYWGTWKKKPIIVKPRRPTAQEEDLEYEFDSDDEWEDEPEDAEDLDNSDKEEEKEDPEDPMEGEPEDEEDEEGWMVPHGYFSDSEREGGEHLDKETLKNNEKEFYSSLKAKTQIGFPVIETEDFSEYKMVLFPKPEKKKVRRSRRRHVAPSENVQDYRKGTGFLAMDLPSEDEDDGDWDSVSNSTDSSSESDSSDGEDSVASDGDDVTCDELDSNSDLNSEDEEDSVETPKTKKNVDKSEGASSSTAKSVFTVLPSEH